MAISKQFQPHTELKASDLNELVTQVNAYIAEINAILEAAIASSTSGIERQATQSEEQAIIYETDGGVQVGKIDSTGADFNDLKRGGQQVARMSDLPTKDSSIGENPSTTNVPTTKAVKDYVDAHSGDYPIDTETTSSEDEEQVWGNDAETQEYVKIGSYGMKSKAYLDMQGNSIIEGEIGNTPSTTHAPSSKAVKDYVDAHGGGDYPIEKEIVQSEDADVTFTDDNDNPVAKIDEEGLKVKSIKGLNGEEINNTLSDYYAAIFRKWGFVGDSLSSGTLEYLDNGVEKSTADYSRSWGADLCRIIGAEGYCFSTPGQTTKGWILNKSYIADRTWEFAQQSANLKEVYTIALGLNDMYYRKREDEYYHYGALVDGNGDPTQEYSDALVLSNIDFNDYANNAESFCGYYAGIIQRLRSVNPKCFIFCITMFDNPNGVYNKIIRKISTLFEKVYLIDPVAEGISVQGWYQGGHLSTLGYERAAKYNLNLINRIIAAHPTEFKGVEFILNHPEYIPE